MQLKTIIALLFLLFICSCKDEGCGPESKYAGTQYLNEAVNPIIGGEHKDDIVFVNDDGDEIHFKKYVDGRSIVKNYSFGTIECDDGSLTRPYVDIEKYDLGYASDAGDTIAITVRTQPIASVNSEYDLEPDNNQQLNFASFFAKLVIPGCPPLRTFRYLVDFKGQPLFTDCVFVKNINGQRFTDLYNVGQGRWTHGLYFSYSKGIVSFFYCKGQYSYKIED